MSSEDILYIRVDGTSHALVKGGEYVLKSLPNEQLWTKFKAFADDKINATQKLKFALGRVNNILSFSHVFKRLLFQGRQKSGLCG